MARTATEILATAKCETCGANGPWGLTATEIHVYKVRGTHGPGVLLSDEHIDTVGDDEWHCQSCGHVDRSGQFEDMEIADYV